MVTQFKKDIVHGLSQKAKTLPSKYFYDKRGDELFIQIMQLPEYYLTKSELEIFSQKSENIIKALEIKPNTYFELIELGAGNGHKTKKLLKALLKKGYNFEYSPIDISRNVLDKLEVSVLNSIPDIKLNKQQGDYLQVLECLKKTKHPKVILFLGSNIGNLDDHAAFNFICKLDKNLEKNDKLILGVDLIKPSSIILPAYNDAQGVTKSFNLNLLRRINEDLSANFNIDKFSHAPEYNEKEGIAKSYLLSLEAQKVNIKGIERIFHFKKNEKILTEISRKYDDAVISKLLLNTNFSVVKKITDRKSYFANYILNKA